MSKKVSKKASKKINFKNVNLNNIVRSSKIEEGGKGTNYSFQEIGLSYIYDEGDGDDEFAFKVEGPEMTSIFGIKTEMFMGKRVSSIFVKFDLENPDHVAFIKLTEGIHEVLVEMVCKKKTSFKVLANKKDDSVKDEFKPLIFSDPKNLTTRSTFFKIVDFEYIDEGEKKFSKAKFTGVNRKELDWEKYLTGKQLTFIPIFTFRRIFVSSTSRTIQFEISSAIVSSIRPSKPSNPDNDIINKMQEQNPNAADDFERELEEIERMNGNSALEAPKASGKMESISKASFADLVGGAPQREIELEFN